MDLGECRRVIGNYILGPRIGKGSFAVVWRSTHRHSGAEVAVKEVDKKHLTHTKIGENLLKEISILTNIRHPNIIRPIETIETEDKIYLVLEYCNGGDLAAYIHRRGKVSQSLASHFTRQLGLQVLHVNCLIHRDLKPQAQSPNKVWKPLPTSSQVLQRYLAPQGLADTLCGSPLYMAPEIIQNKKYDGKADLWSVGAILFQLVTGKPPFNGDSQLQLFQNVLSSRELCFPEGSLKDLNPVCVALCRGLLRHNPVAIPLSLNSFKRASEVAYSSFHDNDDKLLYGKDYGSTSRTQGVQVLTENVECDRLKTSLGGELKSSGQLRVTDLMESFEKDFVLVNAHFASTETSSCSSGICLLNNSTSRILSYPSEKNDQDVAAEMPVKECTTHCLSGPKSQGSYVSASSVSTALREVQGLSILHPSTRLQLLHQYICILSELARGKDESQFNRPNNEVSIEGRTIKKNTIKGREFGTYEESALDQKGNYELIDNMRIDEGILDLQLKKSSNGSGLKQPEYIWVGLRNIVDGLGIADCHAMQQKAMKADWQRIKVVKQWFEAREELIMCKRSRQSYLRMGLLKRSMDMWSGLVLESFSVELVVLAIWKEAFQVCNYWLDSKIEGDLPGKCSAKESRSVHKAASLFLNSEENVDFNMPRAVSIWSEQGFLVAFDRAEKLSVRIQDMDGNAQMPDAMEIVFQAALEVARTGGVDEFMGNKDSAASSYSKAMLLLSFLLGEAMSLPLNPPFSLTPADRKQIEGYLVNFESRHSRFKLSKTSLTQSLDCFTN
ncbi:protein kinase superfamily protein [Actinidia rufa]|uniref:Protein kinase superfamily protein n=1 Tax=Actinidia rufa TaxID=165716 RepID=A0A7J0F583_9ERIC|nr:protein kinase superfamily protein [Actinidia rufa]